MPVIRPVQMTAFEDAALRVFEDRTWVHLQKWFPRHCQLLGEAQMRRVIRDGRAKAARYNLTAEACVRSYIDLMCVLGSGFDTDVLLPWAAEILNDQSSADQLARGDRLYEKAWAYIDHIARDYRDESGQPSTARFVDELRELRRDREEILEPSGAPAFSTQLQERLHRVFPSKCAFVGSDGVRDLVPRAIETAARYGITSRRGVTLVTALILVLGSGFDRDPLLPWASAILTDTAIRDQTTRVDRLLAEGVSVLGRWWDSAPRPAT